jgi:uncharacterized protein (TIGR02118 family)
MRFSYYLSFYARDAAKRASEADLARTIDLVKATTGATKGIVFTPEVAPDPFVEYPPPPQLALQLYFDEIAALEAAIGPRGHLQALATSDALPSVDKSGAEQQAMVVRAYPTPDPKFRNAPGELPCTDFIHYPGKAEDLNAWLRFYFDSHVPMIVRLPNIRAVELFTRLDYVSAMPFRRVEYMQRNKVVFDSVAACRAALESPIRAEMRQDFLSFPKFTEGNRHNPMATRFVI